MDKTYDDSTTLSQANNNFVVEKIISLEGIKKFDKKGKLAPRHI